MTDYKKYALGQVENFLYDAMSSGATPQEIYDTIRGVVEDNYYTYKKCASEAYELLALLNGNGEGHISDATSRGNQIHQEIEDILVGIHDDCRIPCDMEALKYTDEELDAMCSVAEEEEKVRMLTHQESIEAGWSLSDEGIWMSPQKEDKVNKWVLPVEYIDDESFVSLPEDLLEAANLKEGDIVNWIDQGDGSFKMIKVTKSIEMEEC